MDVVSYVNKVGKLVNDSTKYHVKLDRTSIKNIILINHFGDLLDKLEVDNNISEEIKLATITKINNYINCLKKEMNFYPEQIIDPDCILTEVEEYIIQE